ncbi:alpha/beta fold hydrolase [Streptomyces hygroscopicus]|uniref:alpha/beta fold hydrolase n=1 Tax=Streptomyces hygroscopicus TaxID=1912 RepID=UPI003D7674F7
MIYAVHHRTATVNGLDVFYREAGDPKAPVVLLLHGFPTSSHTFRHLIPALADRYHVIAPDHIGFGQSAMPSPGRVFRISPDQAAASGAVHRKAEHHPCTGRTRVMRQRGEVPCRTPRPRGDPKDTP